MEGAAPPVPSAETVDTAYKSIIEFGVVGAILVIILTCCITLVWWVLHSSRKRIEKVEDDAKVRVNTVETQSTERALAYREIIKQKDDQLERFETRLNDVQEKRLWTLKEALKRSGITGFGIRLLRRLSCTSMPLQPSSTIWPPLTSRL